MSKSPKEYVIDKMKSCKGDDLERAKAAFRGMAMDEFHGQSGMTRQQILDGYQSEHDAWLTAISWLRSLP